ncbi:wu:fc21g02 [Gadus macrocephalus]|uniref:wu:fc21g02 n=1 Tax=Gadus macrocephalus TaxID=80720 RepID=UPI0028CB9996|nr:wu:fc21g02 [Gadus macrocephalus]
MNGKSAFEMLGCVVVLLGAILSAECFARNDLHERLAHGRQLKIFLPKTSERLEFIPAGQSVASDVYWEKGQHRPKRGSVFTTGSDRRWTLDKVTYADEGTYIQKDFWQKEVSSVKVAVTPRHVFTKCVAGEDLSVSLEGIELSDATLRFSGENINITLVRDGGPGGAGTTWTTTTGVRPQHTRIDIREVNTTDVGHYTLVDPPGPAWCPSYAWNSRTTMTPAGEPPPGPPAAHGHPSWHLLLLQEEDLQEERLPRHLHLHHPTDDPGGAVLPCGRSSRPTSLLSTWSWGAHGVLPWAQYGSGGTTPSSWGTVERPAAFSGLLPPREPHVPPCGPGVPPRWPVLPPLRPGVPPRWPGVPPRWPGVPPCPAHAVERPGAWTLPARRRPNGLRSSDVLRSTGRRRTLCSRQRPAAGSPG